MPTAMRSSSSLFIVRMIRSRPRELLPVREGALPPRPVSRPRVRLPDPLRARPLRAAGARDQPGRTVVADDAPEAEGVSPRLSRVSTSRRSPPSARGNAGGSSPTPGSSGTGSRSTRRSRTPAASSRSAERTAPSRSGSTPITRERGGVAEALQGDVRLHGRRDRPLVPALHRVPARRARAELPGLREGGEEEAGVDDRERRRARRPSATPSHPEAAATRIPSCVRESSRDRVRDPSSLSARDDRARQRARESLHRPELLDLLVDDLPVADDDDRRLVVQEVLLAPSAGPAPA